MIEALVTLLVVDADTVRTPGGERLRLESIDAPGVAQWAECRVEAMAGALAAARAAELLAGGGYVIDTGRRGGWGRPLVSVRLPDGRLLGDVLVAEGHAVPWAGRPHDFCE